MRYAEFKKRQQDAFDKLPMKAAFGQKQFEEMMASWGLTTTEEDLKKIRSLTAGAYCLATDLHLFTEFTKKRMEEEDEYLSDEENLKDALIYEFGNHECGYTMDTSEALYALGFTKSDVRKNKTLHKVFPIAWKEYLDNCE